MSRHDLHDLKGLFDSIYKMRQENERKKIAGPMRTLEDIRGDIMVTITEVETAKDRVGGKRGQGFVPNMHPLSHGEATAVNILTVAVLAIETVQHMKDGRYANAAETFGKLSGFQQQVFEDFIEMKKDSQPE